MDLVRKLLAMLVVFGMLGSVVICTQEPVAVQLILLDEGGKPLTGISGNAEVQVQIDALVPTGEVYETVFYGVLKKPHYPKFWDSRNLVKISLSDQKLQSVLSKWEKQYPKGIDSSFMISVWVLDYEGGKVYRGFAVVNYNTKDVKQELRRAVEISIHRLPPKPHPENALKGDVSIQGSNRQFYYWRTDWSLSWRPQGYIRVPVLIVDNRYSDQGLSMRGLILLESIKQTLGLQLLMATKSRKPKF